MEREKETTSELYFLIADFLTRYSPCQKAAKMLQEELETYKLLSRGVSVDGTIKNSSFDDVSRKFQTLPSDQLLNVFSNFKHIMSERDHFTGSLLNTNISASITDQKRHKNAKVHVENLFRLRQIESELKRLKILRSVNSERLLESGSRIRQANTTDLLEVNMILRMRGFQSWISESGHVLVHRVCRVSSDTIVALTGSASKNAMRTQKSNDLKPGMFVRISLFEDHDTDNGRKNSSIVGFVTISNPSTGSVRSVRAREQSRFII